VSSRLHIFSLMQFMMDTSTHQQQSTK